MHVHVPQAESPCDCVGSVSVALFGAHLLLGGHHGPDARGREVVPASGQELEGHHEEYRQESKGGWGGKEGGREGGREEGRRKGGVCIVSERIGREAE